ncbi:MAG: hypothetical protein LBM67_08350 [Lentimicrobiaceae bacterium]|jgi:hypothetical protein|nr:hypothetical protein [Lentimicrobiaceae bacterium]
MEDFLKFKKEILLRAKENDACVEQYKEAYNSADFEELFIVIKRNFIWCCENNVINASLFDDFNEILKEHKIYGNLSSNEGYIYAWDNATVEAWGNATVYALDNATVKAWGNATVKALDNATVEAWGNATVEAWDNATVKALDNATVEAWGNATVEAWGNSYIYSFIRIECKLSDNAIYRVINENIIFYSSDNIKFSKINL